MKQGRSYSLWQLVSSHPAETILIPQIQRDYVQYRSGRVEKNLKRFISSLAEALTSTTKSINLNFVYGNTETIFDADQNSSFTAFCPIDGQQRLTTLYLLHYYVFNEAEDYVRKSMLKGRLIYNTRKTTKDFLSMLLEKNTDCFSKRIDIPPSKVITESGWYSSLWDADPSVLSCLKVLDEIHEQLAAVTSWTPLVNRLVDETNCPITFMKLELEKLDNPNELYIKMNSRGKQLTAFENFKSEMYGFIKDLPSDSSVPKDFKAKMDGDWLELIWNMCGESDKYTDVVYRDLLHTCFVNSIISKLPDAKKSFIDELRIWVSQPASSYYIDDYGKCFSNCANQDLLSSTTVPSPLPDILTSYYYTMECLEKINATDSDTYEMVKQAIFDISKDKKNNNTSKLEYYLDNYVPHALLQAICVFANSPEAIAESDSKQYVVRFNAWWRVINNLIKNSEIDDFSSFVSAIQEVSHITYAYDVANYLGELSHDQDDYISLDSLDANQKKEEILKQKIINVNDNGWKEAILNAEKNEYFNGEIYFAFTLSGISKVDDINSCTATDFNENWKLVEDIFNTAKDDNVLMHRVLLTFGDYSKTFSSYDDNTNYLITYYCYNEKHHKQDWRGMLRGDKFNIFKSMFDDFKSNKSVNQKFSEYARDRIINYIESASVHRQNTVEELNYYLIKNEELFKYMISSFRCWYQDGDLRLLKTSKRSTYVNFKLVHIATGCGLSGDIKINEGSGQRHGDYICYNGHEYQCTNNAFGKRLTGEIVANTVDEMIAFLSQP